MNPIMLEYPYLYFKKIRREVRLTLIIMLNRSSIDLFVIKFSDKFFSTKKFCEYVKEM